MILGVGVDLVDVDRFARAAERHGEGFVERILTPEELEDCRRARRPHEQHAARFAVREALLKALGTGLIGRMAWTDVRVCEGEVRGVFRLALRGAVRETADALGVRRTHVAVSTTRHLAAAAVVLED